MSEKNIFQLDDLQNDIAVQEASDEAVAEETAAVNDQVESEPSVETAPPVPADGEQATTEESEEASDQPQLPSSEENEENTENEGSEISEETDESAETEGSEEDQNAPIPYRDRYYLRYGEGKRTMEMDLAGTKAFLQGLGYDGGELRQARAGKGVAETYGDADKTSGNQMRCSYCGCEVSGVDFYRLSDGRIRCTTCSNSVVKTAAEVENICQRVIDNLDNFFGATIDVPVAIEVLEERKLKKKIGAALGEQDDQSVLILGVAINKKKKYSLLLENGAPRISLIATFAHELTHIWQYTHWDNKKGFPKCSKDKRLLIYEGMAKWVEIQYLYLIGETAVARREELFTRNREDEYGVGFCLYEDEYPLSREAMMCEETPFTTDKYPIE